MSPSVLSARHLDAGHGRTLVVDDLTLVVAGGTVTALVGPNGSGKSTLLMTLARVLRAHHGEVLLDGDPIGKKSTIEVARRLGVLPQTSVVPTGATVRGIVEQGRYPQLDAWAMLPPTRRPRHARSSPDSPDSPTSPTDDSTHSRAASASGPGSR